MEILKPYRNRIDALDKQIIDLLRQRYDVIEEVGHLKARENIDPILHDRVDEVRENAASMARDKGLDPEFISNFYTELIKHSCDIEKDIIKGLTEKS